MTAGGEIPSRRHGDRPWPELLFAALFAILISIRLNQQYHAFIALPGADWNSSEWLINYAAGFVRRGLGGQILMNVLQRTGWGFFPLWASFSLAVYIALCGFVLWRTGHTRAATVWRCLLLINPALLLFPAESAPYGSFMRKEVLFVATTAVLIVLAELALRTAPKGRARRAALTAVFLATCAATSTALALIHEGLFLFCWLPLTCAIAAYLLRQLHWSRVALAFALAATFIPSLVATAASVHWHGSTESAQAICESWHPLGVTTECALSTHFPPAVDALGWSTSYAASIPRKAAWRYPFFLLFYAAELIALLVAARRMFPRTTIAESLALLLVPFVLSLPVSAIGWDWGRYTFTVLGQQLLVLLSDSLRPAIHALLPNRLQMWLKTLAERFAKPLVHFADLAMERYPVVAATALLLIPFPSVPPERTLYQASPPYIVTDFFLHPKDPIVNPDN